MSKNYLAFVNLLRKQDKWTTSISLIILIGYIKKAILKDFIAKLIVRLIIIEQESVGKSSLTEAIQTTLYSFNQKSYSAASE